MERYTADPASQPSSRPHLPYLPGLDGLRALAVVAVLLYHADLSMYGGYLGVESFFVLSGFLITALLLIDWSADGRIDLKTFWLRRARRLLPALLVMLAGTLALAALLLPEEFTNLTHDTVAALGYATNWYLIAGGQSYFDAGERPSLLRHLWSLAIEEQFYLIWPLLCAAGLRFLRPGGMLVATAAGALASFALMGVLYDPGADPSRIYYGTDTRAAAILLGAALALAQRPGLATEAPRRGIGIALDLAGSLALALLLIAYVALHEQHPLLYRGGFGGVAVATAVVIFAASHPSARLLPWLLERRPLRWIGLRSYGIYLWHWPIFMVTRPGLDLPYDGWQLQLLRFGLAIGVAALSYALVEEPIRRGALGRAWQYIRQSRASNQLPAAAPTAPPKHAAPSTHFRLATAGPAVTWFWGSTDSQAAHKGAQAARVDEHPEADTKLAAGAPAGHSYRRWTSLVATSVLAIGVMCVAAGVSQGAMRSSLAAPESTPAPTAVAGPDRSQALEPSRPAPTAAATPAAGQAAPAPTPLPEAAFDPALAAELQHILDAAVADGSIPGMVLSVQLPDGTTWTGASGLADREADTAMAPETQVRIGSLSKMLTAVVVLQLVEEGTIGLDAPVSTWLPDLLENGDEISVRQLLQHTSGLYDYLEDRKLVGQAYQDPERTWQPEQLVRYAADLPASFEPGTKGAWDYSSTNYVILGMIVEKATGRTLEQELRQRIFEPLELRHTYAVPAEAVEGPQAHGYSKGTDQTEVAMSFAYGTANIVTTVDDLRRFGDALFSGRLLKPETFALMNEFVGGKGQYGMPELEYGLGLMRNRLPVGVDEGSAARSEEASRVLGHIGGFGGFRAALWYAPESQALLVLSVNQASTDPNDLATEVLDAILAHQEQ